MTASPAPVNAATATQSTAPVPMMAVTPPERATRATTPREASRPAPRDPNLASPPEVVGKVDRGDLSEMLTSPRSPIIEQSEIDSMFENNTPKLQSCFRKAGAANGSEVILGFVIGADGRMASVWPVAAQANVRVTQCVLQTVNAFRFRATPGGTTQATTTIRYEE
jgi:hypothetical protein